MPPIDYDNLDGVSLVASRHSNLSRNLGVAGLAGVMILGLAYVNWPSPATRDARRGLDRPAGDEQFQLPAFPLPRQAVSPLDQGEPAETVTVPQDVPPQETTQVEEPPIETAPEQERADLEQQMREEEARRLAQEESDRQAALEAQEQAEREARMERFQSDQMVMDDAASLEPSDQQALLQAPGDQVVQVPGADSDPNKAFLAQSEQNRITPAVATRNSRPDALIAQGTLIRGFLETAIQSDLPGMVRAVVREDVYSLDGRRVLVPKGSRLVGEYKSGLSRGQTRVYVVWNRIVMSDGIQVDIASPGADGIGRAGLTGHVDTHWRERIGSALIFSVIGGAAQIGAAVALNDDDERPRTITTTDPATGVVTTTTLDSSGSGNDNLLAAVNQGTNGFTQLATQSAQSSENIPPTVHVDQGADVVVFVRRDLDFSHLYADPLQQEIRRLKQGRGSIPGRGNGGYSAWYPPRPVYK